MHVSTPSSSYARRLGESRSIYNQAHSNQNGSSSLGRIIRAIAASQTGRGSGLTSRFRESYRRQLFEVGAAVVQLLQKVEDAADLQARLLHKRVAGPLSAKSRLDSCINPSFHMDFEVPPMSPMATHFAKTLLLPALLKFTCEP